MTGGASSAGALTVRVRLFAALRERAGWAERLVTAKTESATPLSVWRQLGIPAGATTGNDPPAEFVPPTADSSPATCSPTASSAAASSSAASSYGDRDATQGLPEGIRVAVNQAFAAPDTRLCDGDELAYLPPISGG